MARGTILPSESKTIEILKLNGFNFKSENFTCDSCNAGKITKGPHKRSSSNVTKPLEIVHSDIWGPCSYSAIDSSRYFITFLDDYSRHLSVFGLKDKTAKSLLVTFNSFLAWSERKTGN
jgi:hypothetical protein